MKSFVAFILLALCGVAMCDRQAEWLENSRQCAQKHNTNPEDVKKVLSGEIKAADVAPGLKCYFHCMSEKEGITKDGVFQAQALSDKLANSPNKDEIAKAIAACKDVKGTDNCDTAFKIMTCMAQNKSAM